MQCVGVGWGEIAEGKKLVGRGGLTCLLFNVEKKRGGLGLTVCVYSMVC